jgi:predicted dehydrogenase
LAKKAYVGIVGLGRMGRRHFEAYSRNSEVVIGACCDANPETLNFLDSRGFSGRRYHDWHKMLKEESLDMLSIVTNGPSHAEITIEAALAKVPRIVCEKPMATSIKNAKRMIETAQANGTRLAINYTRRWSEAYRNLKKTLREGTIGNICQVYCVCGGGLLACNGSHFFDLMRFLSDSEADTVVGFIDKRGTPNPRGAQFTDPGAFGIVRFRNGMRGFVDMYEDLGIPPKIEIIGSIGWVVIDESKDSWLIESREGRDRLERLGRYDLPLVAHQFPAEALDPIRLFERTIKEILGEEPISCTGTDGLADLQMIMGFHTSDHEGSIPLSLPLSSKYDDLVINFT